MTARDPHPRQSSSPLRRGYAGIDITVAHPDGHSFTVDWQLAADRLVAALASDPRGTAYDYALAHTLLTRIFDEET